MCLSCTKKTKSECWRRKGNLTVKEKSALLTRWWSHNKQHLREWKHVVRDYWHRNKSSTAISWEMWPIGTNKSGESIIGWEANRSTTQAGGQSFRESHNPIKNQDPGACIQEISARIELIWISQTNYWDSWLRIAHCYLKGKIGRDINRQRNPIFERWWYSRSHSIITKQKLQKMGANWLNLKINNNELKKIQLIWAWNVK